VDPGAGGAFIHSRLDWTACKDFANASDRSVLQAALNRTLVGSGEMLVAE
jgi:hypothetical protein